MSSVQLVRIVQKSSVTASKKGVSPHPRIKPRPWLINLVARALRLVAGSKNTVTIAVEDHLAKLTHLVTTSVWNSLKVMEFRGWIKKRPNYVEGHGKQSAANTYEFTELFPFPNDYFSRDQRRLCIEISNWSEPPKPEPAKMRGRHLSLLWGLARHVDAQRHAREVSRTDLSLELDFGIGPDLRRRSVSAAKRFKSLADLGRIRIHRSRLKGGTGKWAKNDIELAGPSGFLEGPCLSGPVPEKNPALRNKIITIVRKHAGKGGWARLPQREIGEKAGCTEKAAKFHLQALVRRGIMERTPKDVRAGFYVQGYRVLSTANSPELPKFPKRARFIREEMRKRGLSLKKAVKDPDSPARNTWRSALRGDSIGPDSVEGIRRVLSAYGTPILPAQIPSN
jgi:hypothetical protein